ncbi:MAG: hypothetical protein V2A76_03135, partial [Planctomycetota bacterium]
MNNVREADIDAFGGRAMVVFIKDGWAIGFAYYDGSSWSRGTVEPPALPTKFEDPSVTHVTAMVGSVATVVFLCVYKTGGQVYARRFDESSGTWGSRITVANLGGVGVDKPWVIAGAAAGPSGPQNAHVAFFDTSMNLWSSFSTDGGSSWTTQMVIEPGSISPKGLRTGFCAQPAIGDISLSGPHSYYIAVTPPSGSLMRWKIVEAIDVATPPNPPDWQFGYLSTGTANLEMEGLGVVNDQIHIPG